MGRATMKSLMAFFFFIVTTNGANAQEISAEQYREDALSIQAIVNEHYAYLDRFPSAALPTSDNLDAEAASVKDRRSLVRYAERALLMLADHHVGIDHNIADSWANTPAFDLWIEKCGESYVIDGVRDGTDAQHSGIAVGHELIAVQGVPIELAVENFWNDLGRDYNDIEASFAARLLAAGKRNSERVLTVRKDDGSVVSVNLLNLYQKPLQNLSEGPPVIAHEEDGALHITIMDSLYRNETIGAFDEAMSLAAPNQPVILDLTETPSGGNTTVARAILSWFVKEPRFYQMHSLPEEERRFGIVRQWVEQVHPRSGKFHSGPLEVRVGRWTGSMGEGLAIGFDAIGKHVVGSQMSGLRGAIYNYTLEHSGIRLSLPTERLMHVDGTPREQFVPERPHSEKPSICT